MGRRWTGQRSRRKREMRSKSWRWKSQRGKARGDRARGRGGQAVSRKSRMERTEGFERMNEYMRPAIEKEIRLLSSHLVIQESLEPAYELQRSV